MIYQAVSCSVEDETPPLLRPMPLTDRDSPGSAALNAGTERRVVGAVRVERREKTASSPHNARRHPPSIMPRPVTRCRLWTATWCAVCVCCILHSLLLPAVRCADGPADVDGWGVLDVSEWLTSIGLSAYSESFMREAIDGEVLLELTADDITGALGVSKLGHRKKLEKEIAQLAAAAANSPHRTPHTPAASSHTPPPDTTHSQTPHSSRPPSSPSVVHSSSSRSPPSATSTSSPLSPALSPGAAHFEAAAAAAARKREKKKGKSAKADEPQKPGRRANSASYSPSSAYSRYMQHTASRGQLGEMDRSRIREWLREALSLHQSGELESARTLYTRVLDVDPTNARAVHMLGLIVMVADNDAPTAISLLERSIELSDESDARVNLGNFFWQQKQAEAAMEQWEYALSQQVIAGGGTLRARYADTAYAAAMQAYQDGEMDKCRSLLTKALRLSVEAEWIHYPDDHQPPPYLPDSQQLLQHNRELTHQIRQTMIDAWLHLGILAEHEEQAALALVCYDRALQVQPDSMDDSYREPVRISTIRQEVQNYRANLLSRLREESGKQQPFSTSQLTKAEYEADSLSVERTSSRHKKLVEYLHKTCHFQQANTLAHLIHDDVIFHSPAYTFLFTNTTHIQQERQKYDSALDALLDDSGMRSLWPQPAGLEWCRYRFYIAYHGLNNKQLNQKLARTYLHLAPSLAYTSPHLRAGQLLDYDGRRKIRVAFLSAFLTYHPVGRTLQGYIEHLPRDKFEVIVLFPTLQPNVDNDPLLLNMQQWADKFIRLPVERTAQSREIVETVKPDVLIYGDLGMEPSSFFLAFSRLAPIQALTFGHPDTSGIDTIDYFISHADMDEQTAGSEQYSERLVALPGVGYWHQSTPPATPMRREEVGLADHQLNLPRPANSPPGADHAWTMYLVTKSVQFYSPDFMDALAHILHRHPSSFVALVHDIGKQSRGFDVHNQCQETILDGIESRLYALQHQTNTSAAVSSPAVPSRDRSAISGRVRFVDKGDHDYFMSLLAMTDVLLQPMPLDGTTTTLEAASLATPTVLFAGHTIGGRMGHAIYTHMHVTDNIAHSKQQYIDIAVRLGRDRQFNAELREAVKVNRDRYRLFKDEQAIAVMAEWLERAVREKMR